MDIREVQGYLYFFFIVILTLVLYGYIVHLYRSEKKGERDYEKYGKMALDDEITSKPVEPIEKDENAKEKKEQ
ncbi:cytochrome c oxidase, cbb3-type, CcoQ subunit [Nitrosophilus kaiyonis]|uniref:cytochrome c oxidase, cbb3-type, CcoQ subunit n=1 Tax=Nitrosophilus kaiyonis TaxID=2930200 RepID=UPI0024921CBD|nr:cytochrome c oxidase, cbb3-type, CcoQ subunit [Nitrosophilus kaiyonis]